jgi:DNA-directed RNA polymerase specialized sigma24 family protein
MADPHYSRIDWNRLLKLLPPLTACAARWFLEEGILGRDDLLPATGTSPKEFAFDTILKFAEGGLKFRPKSPETYERDLFSFLRTVMRHDFLDLIKSHEYDRTDVIDAVKAVEDEQPGPVLEELPDASAGDGFYSLEAAAIARKVLPLVEDDPELKEFVEAVLCFGRWKREDIAEILGITPQEVTYRKNRLRVKLASWYRSVQASRKWASTHEKEGRQPSTRAD